MFSVHVTACFQCTYVVSTVHVNACWDQWQVRSSDHDPKGSSYVNQAVTPLFEGVVVH